MTPEERADEVISGVDADWQESDRRFLIEHIRAAEVLALEWVAESSNINKRALLAAWERLRELPPPADVAAAIRARETP